MKEFQKTEWGQNLGRLIDDFIKDPRKTNMLVACRTGQSLKQRRIEVFEFLDRRGYIIKHNNGSHHIEVNNKIIQFHSDDIGLERTRSMSYQTLYVDSNNKQFVRRYYYRLRP